MTPSKAPLSSPAFAPAHSPEETTTGLYCFSILAAADAGVLVRILGLFAKRGLTPTRCHSDLYDDERLRLSIDLQVEGLSQKLAGLIARSMRQIYGVEAVLFSKKVSS